MIAAALLFLKRLPSWVLPVVAGAILLVSAGLWIHHRGIVAGRIEGQAMILRPKQTRDSLLVVKLDTVVRRDTVRLSKALTHYDTVRASVNIHDTVEVIKTLAAADTAVRVCRETVNSLTLSCAAKDTVIADLRQLLRINAPPAPPALSWRQRVTWLVVGVVLDEAARRARR